MSGSLSCLLFLCPVQTLILCDVWSLASWFTVIFLHKFNRCNIKFCFKTVWENIAWHGPKAFYFFTYRVDTRTEPCLFKVVLYQLQLSSLCSSDLFIPPGCEKPSVCVHNVTFSIRGFITLAWKRQIKDEQYFTLLFWKIVLCCIEYYVWYQSVSVVFTNTERGECRITMRAHICIRCYYLIASHLGSDSRLWWKNPTRKDNATLTVTHQFTLSPLVISTVSRDTE